MPRQQGTSGRFEPTAPPIHMMPNHYSQPADDRELRDRSPPPRYEEAIAEDRPLAAPTAAPAGQLPPQVPSHRNGRIPLSPHRRIATNSHRNAGQCRPSSCNSSRISTPNRSPEHGGRSRPATGSRRPRSSNSRHRSHSPGELSDGSHEERDLFRDTTTRNMSEDNTASQTRTVADKKRGSGSKIKKGLENIAFFIIQLLD